MCVKPSVILESSVRKLDPTLSLTAMGLYTILEDSSVGCLLENQHLENTRLYFLNCPTPEWISSLGAPQYIARVPHLLVK